jgi:hypothetical protein
MTILHVDLTDWVDFCRFNNEKPVKSACKKQALIRFFEFLDGC